MGINLNTSQNVFKVKFQINMSMMENKWQDTSLLR